jgi:hypothetical protein
MRSVMILLALSLPGCLFEDFPDDDRPPSGDDDDDNDPPDPPGPPSVDLGMDRKVAAGTREHYSRPTFSNGYLGVILESSDPEMLEASIIDDDQLGFVTHGPGTYTLTARREGFPQILDTMTIRALPVEDILFDAPFSPDVNPDIDTIAMLANTGTTACATYYGPGHDRIPGHGTFTTTGDLQVLDDDASGQADIRSTCIAMAAGAAGTAELVGHVEGGISRTLVVEIHAAAASASFKLSTFRNGVTVDGPPALGETGTIRLISRTANGTFLSGVSPAWTITPKTSNLPLGDGLLFAGAAPGTETTITATVGAQTFTTTFVAP